MMTRPATGTTRRTQATRASFVAVALLAMLNSPSAQRSTRKPLAPADIDDIATLLMLEDKRQLDEPVLKRILASTPHPEVRRRAVQAIGRIAKSGGRALLASARDDADPEIVATVAFSLGQLKDEASVSWLSERLLSPGTPAAVASEAARSLGKIRSVEARAALTKYLSSAATSASAVVVGEALLAMGRFTTREDLAPLVRWVASPDVEIRWRAAWALFRPRDPAAVPHLLKLSNDSSAEVRYWAVRGLAPAPPPAGRGNAAPAPADEWANIDKAPLSARLRDAFRDPDRRVRTEALRALAQDDDDASFAVVIGALDSPDSWLSVSAAEGLGRFGGRADTVVPKLVAATAADKPLGLRMTALASLVTVKPDAALEPCLALIRDTSLAARGAAAQALRRIGPAGLDRLDKLADDPATRDLIPTGGGRGQPRPAYMTRTQADYRAIVERWVVPDYNGAGKPRAVWETPRGQIELELYAGDAPLAVDYFVHVVESGQIVGTEFGRVVPDFVAQQRRSSMSRFCATRSIAAG